MYYMINSSEKQKIDSYTDALSTFEGRTVVISGGNTEEKIRFVMQALLDFADNNKAVRLYLPSDDIKKQCVDTLCILVANNSGYEIETMSDMTGNEDVLVFVLDSLKAMEFSIMAGCSCNEILEDLKSEENVCDVLCFGFMEYDESRTEEALGRLKDERGIQTIISVENDKIDVNEGDNEGPCA